MGCITCDRKSKEKKRKKYKKWEKKREMLKGSGSHPPSLFCVQSELVTEHQISRAPTAEHCDEPTDHVDADGCAVQPNIISSLASTTPP